MTRPSEAEVTEAMVEAGARVLARVGKANALTEKGWANVSNDEDIEAFKRDARYEARAVLTAALSTPPLPSAEPCEVYTKEQAEAMVALALAADRHARTPRAPLPSAEPVAWPLADEDGRKGGWTYDFAWLERIADEVADEDNGRPCPEIVEGIALRLARTTPPAAAQDTGDDDDSFLADAAPTLLGQLSRKAVQAAVDEATDADGWVRFVDGQVVSRNALLNKLVALDSDAARAAGGE